MLAVIACACALAYLSRAGAADSNCARACLQDYVDRYLAAMVAHDPAHLLMSASVKFTENGQPLKLGDALWGTAEGLGDYKLYFVDPVAGQVGFFGTVRESGRLALLALRVKIEHGKISEIETVVARQQSQSREGFNQFATLKDQPLFHEPLAPDDTHSRAELVKITNTYFEGLEKATGKLTPFAPDCTRIENGNITANNPDSPRAMAKMTCGQQFDTGFSTFITHVRERRFPVVDVERGLVFALIFFDHAGKVKTVKLADGSTLTVPPPFDAPYSFSIAELFKIRNGKITRIEAVLLPVPYGMPSGWRSP